MFTLITGIRNIATRRFVVALACFIAFHGQAQSAELAEQAESLRMVPDDAAFYSASLRLQEQINIFRESNAYSKLMEIPLVQLAKMQVEQQWRMAGLPGIREAKDYIESPEGEETVAVLKEMFSDEIFMYGGGDIATLLEIFMELNSIQQTAGLEAAASDEEPGDVIARRVRALFEERADDIAVPTVVFGFRVKDADRAGRQLDEVQTHLRKLFDEQRPELSAHLQRDQIGGHDFLTLRLDGSMIPWDELREETEEADREEFDKWRDLVDDKTLAVALGVVDGFVLLSLGETTDHLETIGQGKLLADHPAIERLEKHSGERVVSISYVSKTLATSTNSSQQQMQDLANMADQALAEAEISEEHRKLLADDIRELDFSQYVGEAGDTASIAFLTDRGYEGFQYQTGEQPMLDSSKPLTILEHVGGNPIFFAATRSNDTVEDYDAAIEWLTETAKHVEQIAESKSEPEQWAEYLKFRDRGIELLKRLNTANREYLYPAFADNQGAVVLDTSAKSKQWHDEMPESPEELPMIELGIVCSVSDAEKLREGVKEYIAVIRDAIVLAREIHPEDFPEFELPKAEKRELESGGTVYHFPLPAEWGLDENIAPNAGITETAAALTTMPETTERLLASTPLEIDTSLDLKRPAAAVVHFKIAKTIESIRPWIDYGLGVATGTIKVEEEEDAEGEDDDEAAEQSPLMFQMGLIVPQVYQFLDVISTMQSATSITYEEDDAWVTHFETRIKDLED